jgi:membrane protease YdiL (CAAX protease family)
MLAFLLLGSASGLLSRAQLGALPALWRIETDVSELDDYLKRPDLVSKAASLVQTDKGPDCECINKNAKVGGPDCECINKAPEAVATARKDVADLDALKKKVESADVKDMPTMLALLKSMYARFQTNIADAQKLEANADATFATTAALLTRLTNGGGEGTLRHPPAMNCRLRTGADKGTAGLESPRREAVTVVINYSVMALPSLFILWRQLKALPRAQAPQGGWLQWRLRPWPGAISSAVAGWLMVTPVVVATGWLLVRLVGDPGGSNPLLELVLGSKDPLALFLLGWTAVVLAPLFEETIFRGALLPVLAKRWGTAGGVVLSALLFAMAHISIGELAPLTVLGVGLALLRVSTGRLLPSVLMHALWNAITFLNLLVL